MSLLDAIKKQNRIHQRVLDMSTYALDDEKVVVEGMWGYSFDKPVRHLREYLSVLLPLVRGESVAFEGDTIKGVGAVVVPGATPFPVVIAALGPQLLALAGTVTVYPGHGRKTTLDRERSSNPFLEGLV